LGPLVNKGLAFSTFSASVIGIMELTKAAQTASEREIKLFEIYLFISVVYWAIAYSMSRLPRWVEIRMSPERAA
jgi:ABC-type amino acid transport system permease subunit